MSMSISSQIHTFIKLLNKALKEQIFFTKFAGNFKLKCYHGLKCIKMAYHISLGNLQYFSHHFNKISAGKFSSEAHSFGQILNFLVQPFKMSPFLFHFADQIQTPTKKLIAHLTLTLNIEFCCKIKEPLKENCLQKFYFSVVEMY